MYKVGIALKEDRPKLPFSQVRLMRAKGWQLGKSKI